jgi:hypothetical protein
MIERRTAQALQIAVLLCADALLAVILLLNARDQGPVFDLLGAGAVAGVVVSAVALAAVLTRSRGLGGTALLLAWLCLIAVPIAAGVIAVRSGADAVIGLVETFILALAILDALAGLIAGFAANRSAQA